MFAADVVIMDGVCCCVLCVYDVVNTKLSQIKWLVAKQAGNVNVVRSKMALSLY